MPELNPKEGEQDPQDPNLNPQGDEDIKDEDLDYADDLEQELEKDALEIFNKKVGKNYKSWEDVAKSENQRDIEFAQRPPKKDDPKPQTEESDFTVSERLLKLENKELGSVMVDIIAEIKRDHPGKDPLKVWEASEFYKNEANARAEKKRAEERISNPTGVGGGEGDDEEKRMSKKFFRNYPPGIKVPKLNK